MPSQTPLTQSPTPPFSKFCVLRLMEADGGDILGMEEACDGPSLGSKRPHEGVHLSNLLCGKMYSDMLWNFWELFGNLA